MATCGTEPARTSSQATPGVQRPRGPRYNDGGNAGHDRLAGCATGPQHRARRGRVVAHAAARPRRPRGVRAGAHPGRRVLRHRRDRRHLVAASAHAADRPDVRPARRRARDRDAGPRRGLRHAWRRQRGARLVDLSRLPPRARRRPRRRLPEVAGGRPARAVGLRRAHAPALRGTPRPAPRTRPQGDAREPHVAPRAGARRPLAGPLRRLRAGAARGPPRRPHPGEREPPVRAALPRGRYAPAARRPRARLRGVGARPRPSDRHHVRLGRDRVGPRAGPPPHRKRGGCGVRRVVDRMGWPEGHADRAEGGSAMAAAVYALKDFIADVDRIARDERSAHEVAERVSPLLARLIARPESVPAEFRRRPEGGTRGRYMLHRAPHFNVVSVIWGPGETAPAHNHETWGVIGVIENEIEETRYKVQEGAAGGRATLDVTRVMRHRPGAVSCLVPGDEVHRMHNPTARDTVEIHVYGKDLDGLPRKTWEPDGREKPLVSPKYLNC